MLTQLLTNKEGFWTSDETWSIPTVGTEGNIGLAGDTGQLLGLKDDTTTLGMFLRSSV